MFARCYPAWRRLVEFAGAKSRITTLLDTTVKLVSECEGMLAGSGGVARAARSVAAPFRAAHLAAVLMCALCGFADMAFGAGPVAGTSDDDAQQDARRQLPYDKLSGDALRVWRHGGMEIWRRAVSVATWMCRGTEV